MKKAPNLHSFTSIIAFLILGLATHVSFAQDPEYFIEKSLQENDFSKKIPSLDSLKAIARENSPLIKYDEADMAYAQANIKLARTKWLDFIYGDATYNYGMFDYLSSEQLQGISAINQSLINTEASRYTVGVSMKIPISAIFNRKKNIKAEEALYTRAKNKKEATIREIERVLILNYTDLLKAHRLLFISGTIVETYKVQSKRAETDYKNGLISISEYTRLQQQMNEAYKELERQKSEFLLAFMYLENTIGTKLDVQW
ncbi:TolC family protein [Zhouia sp. PK063]|uniref:TolC family protein n=1 Tax=Zhouia sp. PK063 TaxID=3373602 RepID=UPI00379C7D32